MNVSNCDLQNSLEQSTFRSCRFMPNLLKSIMRLIPGTSIKKIDGLLESGI
jgi:hypothetical protein